MANVGKTMVSQAECPLANQADPTNKPEELRHGAHCL